MNLNVDQYLTENQGIVALLATLGAKENKDQMYFILCVNGTSRFLWGSSVFSLWPKVPGSFRTYVGLESCQACCYLGGSVVIGPSTNAFLVNLEKQPLSIHEQEKKQYRPQLLVAQTAECVQKSDMFSSSDPFRRTLGSTTLLTGTSLSGRTKFRSSRLQSSCA